MSDKAFAATLVLCGILLALLFSLDPNNRVEDETPFSPPIVEFVPETTSTTTTTIDLSFLNTTTTTTPAPAVAQPQNVTAFFECIRWRESRGNYAAVNPTGTFMGAYQIYQGGWDHYAALINRDDLVGVQPHTAAPTDQDSVALAMYNDLGAKPWGGACQ